MKLLRLLLLYVFLVSVRWRALAATTTAGGSETTGATTTAIAATTGMLYTLPEMADGTILCGPELDLTKTGDQPPKDLSWVYQEEWGCCGPGCNNTGACCSFACETEEAINKCSTIGVFLDGCIPSSSWRDFCNDDNECLPRCACSRRGNEYNGQIFKCVFPPDPPTPPPMPTGSPTRQPTSAPTPSATLPPNPCNYESCVAKPVGSETCPCRPLEPRCDGDLMCNNKTRLCITCPEGESGCQCKSDGTCKPTLSCVDGLCVGDVGEKGALKKACRLIGEASRGRQCNRGLYCSSEGICELCESPLGHEGCPCDDRGKFCKIGLACNVPAGVCAACPDTSCACKPVYKDDPCLEFSCNGCKSDSCRFCNTNGDNTCVNSTRPCPSGGSPNFDLDCDEYDCGHLDNCGGVSVGECKGSVGGPVLCECYKGKFVPDVGCVVEEVEEGCYVGTTPCSVFIAVGCVLGAIVLLLVLGVCFVKRRARGGAASADGTALSTDVGPRARKASSRSRRGSTQLGRTTEADTLAGTAAYMQQGYGGYDGSTYNGGTYNGGYDGGSWNGQAAQQQWDAWGGTYNNEQAAFFQQQQAAYDPSYQQQQQQPTVVTVNFQDVTRAQACVALENAAPGSYLVRPSSREACLSLSFKSQSSGKVEHMLLVNTDQGWQKEDDGQYYADVGSLLRDGLRELQLALS